MSMWTILANLSVIMRVVADIESVIGQVVGQQPPVPSLEQVKKIMDGVRSLIDGGIIKIPGMDGKMLSDKISEIETLLSQGAYELLKTVLKTTAPQVVMPASHPDIPVAAVLPEVK